MLRCRSMNRIQRNIWRNASLEYNVIIFYDVKTRSLLRAIDQTSFNLPLKQTFRKRNKRKETRHRRVSGIIIFLKINVKATKLHGSTQEIEGKTTTVCTYSRMFHSNEEFPRAVSRVCRIDAQSSALQLGLIDSVMRVARTTESSSNARGNWKALANRPLPVHGKTPRDCSKLFFIELDKNLFQRFSRLIALNV